MNFRDLVPRYELDDAKFVEFNKSITADPQCNPQDYWNTYQEIFGSETQPKVSENFVIWAKVHAEFLKAGFIKCLFETNTGLFSYSLTRYAKMKYANSVHNVILENDHNEVEKFFQELPERTK